MATTDQRGYFGQWKTNPSGYLEFLKSNSQKSSHNSIYINAILFAVTTDSNINSKWFSIDYFLLNFQYFNVKIFETILARCLMDLLNKRKKLSYILNNIFLKQVISKYRKTHFLAKRSPKVNHNPLSLSHLSILQFSDSNSALAGLYGRTKASPFDKPS